MKVSSFCLGCLSVCGKYYLQISRVDVKLQFKPLEKNQLDIYIVSMLALPHTKIELKGCCIKNSIRKSAQSLA